MFNINFQSLGSNSDALELEATSLPHVPQLQPIIERQLFSIVFVTYAFLIGTSVGGFEPTTSSPGYQTSTIAPFGWKNPFLKLVLLVYLISFQSTFTE